MLDLKNHKKPFIVTLVALFVVFGAIFAWHAVGMFFMKKYFATFVPPPQVVSTAVAKSENWQPYLSAVGNMTAINGVDISPEVSGQVTKIFFNSGEFVKKGQPLIQLDDAQERAQLADVQAQLQLAQTNLKREKRLFSQKVSSQSALDDAVSKEKQVQANFDNISSSISKKLIQAPFDGNIGIKQINIGQFIAAGQLCASLQAINALYAKFYLPQQDLNKVSLKQLVKVSSDAFPNENFEGYISAIDSKVDENTRTIEIQATIDNTSGKLYPGMYVSLNLFLPIIPNAVVLPQTAVTYTLYGDSAFIVNLNDKKDDQNRALGVAKRVFVKTDDKQENRVVISEGIKAGDIVIDSGQNKLDDGSTVAINNSNPL